MKKNRIYTLLFVLGLIGGLFFGLNKLRASNPEGEISGGEQPASVYYDEFWQAVQALVSTETGYQNFNPTSHNNTSTAAKIEDTSGGWLVRVSPKMVVTKWKVHGHIHFE